MSRDMSSVNHRPTVSDRIDYYNYCSRELFAVNGKQLPFPIQAIHRTGNVQKPGVYIVHTLVIFDREAVKKLRHLLAAKEKDPQISRLAGLLQNTSVTRIDANSCQIRLTEFIDEDTLTRCPAVYVNDACTLLSFSEDFGGVPHPLSPSGRNLALLEATHDPSRLVQGVEVINNTEDAVYWLQCFNGLMSVASKADRSRPDGVYVTTHQAKNLREMNLSRHYTFSDAYQNLKFYPSYHAAVSANAV